MSGAYRGGAELRQALQRLLEAEGAASTRLEALAVTARARRLFDEVLDQRVMEARSFHHTWEDIAAAVGITRQSAHRRWRHLEADAAALAADRERRFRARRLATPPARRHDVPPEEWGSWRPGAR